MTERESDLATELRNAVWLLQQTARELNEALSRPGDFDLETVIRYQVQSVDRYCAHRWADFKERMGWK